jgi:uncharacterized protein
MKQLIYLSTEVLQSAWEVLLDSSPYVIFGFLVAGLLKAFLPDNLVAKHLGKGKTAGIFKSALVGIPLPLCSCGVLPAAAGLKEQGAGKGAISSFMISTPETGVDSIAITYALLDPIMAIIRPVSAFITAISTGLFINLTDRGDEVESAPPLST